MKRVIRSGMGLGDSLYLQSVARYFVGKGENVDVCSAWPDVFRPLAGKVTVYPFRRERITTVAHYSTRRGVVGTTQFEDCCITAGIREKVDLRLDWSPINVEMVARLRAQGRPVIAVQLPRAPMDRKDGLGIDLLPDRSVLQAAIDMLAGFVAGRAYLIQIGAGEPVYKLHGFNLDLANKTTVCDLLDVAYAVDAFIGYVSFMVPLAESLRKPCLMIWSRKGLKSPHQVIRQMTPEKILHRESSRHVFDDCTSQELSGLVDALLDQATSRAAA